MNEYGLTPEVITKAVNEAVSVSVYTDEHLKIIATIRSLYTPCNFFINYSVKDVARAIFSSKSNIECIFDLTAKIYARIGYTVEFEDKLIEMVTNSVQIQSDLKNEECLIPKEYLVRTMDTKAIIDTLRNNKWLMAICLINLYCTETKLK